MSVTDTVYEGTWDLLHLYPLGTRLTARQTPALRPAGTFQIQPSKKISSKTRIRSQGDSRVHRCKSMFNHQCRVHLIMQVGGEEEREERGLKTLKILNHSRVLCG